MVQILLMLAVLFTQDSEVENLFCGALSGSEPSLTHGGRASYFLSTNHLLLPTAYNINKQG